MCVFMWEGQHSGECGWKICARMCERAAVCFASLVPNSVCLISCRFVAQHHVSGTLYPTLCS